ncbi:hypothetical protein [Nonomuraea sp. GTA35]|uniref:hypothetical protein n=1 Tax=Nonomuraea sp. GTA35 TaxID=1676746 RepID=UPI0035BED493
MPGTAGMQGMYGAGFTGPQVWTYRWTYEPDGWAQMLTGAGFRNVSARVEPAPNPQNVGTLIVEAQA